MAPLLARTALKDVGVNLDFVPDLCFISATIKREGAARRGPADLAAAWDKAPANRSGGNALVPVNSNPPGHGVLLIGNGRIALSQ
ncbi:hypothetical protein HPB50_023609 [Hyalomma asiaticum]|uniref:Uncharacterized protein n=1 Tax=Hyalomma asiaticum TaxID=266040 RepID=A0ACB7T3Y1_HYAAI|nr:hypothetical protein HPB50_023609 [Hyalomma asiaticum]